MISLVLNTCLKDKFSSFFCSLCLNRAPKVGWGAADTRAGVRATARNRALSGFMVVEVVVVVEWIEPNVWLTRLLCNIDYLCDFELLYLVVIGCLGKGYTSVIWCVDAPSRTSHIWWHLAKRCFTSFANDRKNTTDTSKNTTDTRRQIQVFYITPLKMYFHTHG